MVSRKVLEELLQQPLGPYRDRDVLHETVCQMSGATELVLYSFVLEHNGHVVGLDESEHDSQERDNRFRGLLKIANPDWLSDFGLKTVETELNLRVTERALREGERRPPQLTLEGLFGNGLLTKSNKATWRKEDETKLVIRIQGERNMPATYMLASQAPNGLLWHSKAHDRKYQIATMDVETYSRSENFFWQWRLYALMEKISSQYPFIAQKKRTPIWFVTKYIERFACPPEDRYRRLIFDEEDTDVDSETGKTTIPRHLLKPHASEILGLFASQAGWIVENNEMRRNKIFDIGSWEGFAKQVQKESKEAARRGLKWGLPVGREAEDESDENQGEGELDRLVRKNPVIGKSNKAVVRKMELALARSRAKHEDKPIVSSSSESEKDVPGGAVYVSDFSEPSDTENDSEHQDAEEKAVDRVPWQLQLPPLLPDVDGRWWCPLRECNYQIDLHYLKEEEGRGIPEDLFRYILQKEWQNAARDEKVLRGFKGMVTNHYLKHFEEQGVRAERRDGRIRFTFINGRQRRRNGEEHIRGPMPAQGTLGGESRVVPIVHAQGGYFP